MDTTMVSPAIIAAASPALNVQPYGAKLVALSSLSKSTKSAPSNVFVGPDALHLRNIAPAPLLRGESNVNSARGSLQETAATANSALIVLSVFMTMARGLSVSWPIGTSPDQATNSDPPEGVAVRWTVVPS